jgi:hypothetical protein
MVGSVALLSGGFWIPGGVFVVLTAWLSFCAVAWRRFDSLFGRLGGRRVRGSAKPSERILPKSDRWRRRRA